LIEEGGAVGAVVVLVLVATEVGGVASLARAAVA
jgi:hypothetical protein